MSEIYLVMYSLAQLCIVCHTLAQICIVPHTSAICSTKIFSARVLKNYLVFSTRRVNCVLYALWVKNSLRILRSTWRKKKRAQKVKKAPRYSQICATGYDLRRNRLLGINVSRYTVTVLENVLSVYKNPQVHSNSRGSYFLGMNVSPRTGIVVKNILSE